ncbi:ribonucleases P/MRP protein subunit POP1-domain-containing protein [Hygrophoropsis aurantiaca]|uniref:Ribonucleases P/MRP protein subunit POP1-domain-containing protein n=1 Tax=Hygrophoropsis aurantiaca TaxID=72124 RepID=A0ACB8AR24_9AGAM|nr:ribonucleases P/MRP protein subunit POP1-domain-containing protein [Hygrophoropsis aurantiaca]
MAPKRKNDQSDELTSRDRKKQKMADARTIAVQPTASTSNYIQGNAEAGPSKTVVRFDSMQGLPSAIDVEKFTEARAYEIDAMQKAIQNAGEGSTHRAWQTLPRHLRRRAASHDVRRVPVRLRDKARAEMDPVRKKALGRSHPKRGKANQISRTDSFLRRQKDKAWLETHIWHAKRTKMENLWGYRLAVTPTEKSFRPSHRASMHGSILHDASYFSLIELNGPESILQAILESCCDPQGPGTKRGISGSRMLDMHIYKPGSYPFDLVGPVSILWKPLQVKSGKSDEPDPEPSEQPKTRKRKGKAKATEEPDPSRPVFHRRMLWVRSHPAIHEEVSEALKSSASQVLQAAKQRDPETRREVQIADMRDKVNVFEIMGPKSSQVIKGALTPAGDENRQEFKKFWSSLTDLQTAGSLPRGMIIGFKVLDPRLKFPPKNAKPQKIDPQHPSSSPAFSFPTSVLAQSDIWDEASQGGPKKPRYKKKDLDDRRAKNLVPGTALRALRQDDRVPVLLIQRSLESTSSSQQSIHGWYLIVPANWSMPFLSSLVYTGTRIAGQRERETQAFEAGTAYFPRDYPLTPFYQTFADERELKEKEAWERKPSAKRPNFEKLQTRSPWKPDWEVVLGLQAPAPPKKDMVTTQREVNAPEASGGNIPDTSDPDATNINALDDTAPDSNTDAPAAIHRVIRPWLLRGPEVPTILEKASKMFNQGAALLAEINRLRTKRSMDILGSDVRMEELLQSALVVVRVEMYGRGCPDNLAMMYPMNDTEARMWLKSCSKGNGKIIQLEDIDGAEISETIPPSDTIIGYITTGNFSLSRGQGFAIGALPVAKLFNLQQQAQRLGQKSALVKIRNRDGTTLRLASLDLVEG